MLQAIDTDTHTLTHQLVYLLFHIHKHMAYIKLRTVHTAYSPKVSRGNIHAGFWDSQSVLHIHIRQLTQMPRKHSRRFLRFAKCPAYSHQATYTNAAETFTQVFGKCQVFCIFISSDLRDCRGNIHILIWKMQSWRIFTAFRHLRGLTHMPAHGFQGACAYSPTLPTSSIFTHIHAYSRISTQVSRERAHLRAFSPSLSETCMYMQRAHLRAPCISIHAPCPGNAHIHLRSTRAICAYSQRSFAHIPWKLPGSAPISHTVNSKKTCDFSRPSLKVLQLYLFTIEKALHSTQKRNHTALLGKATTVLL